MSLVGGAGICERWRRRGMIGDDLRSFQGLLGKMDGYLG